MDEMLPMQLYAIVISNTIIVIYTYNIYIYIIDLPYEPMDWFLHVVAFNAG